MSEPITGGCLCGAVRYECTAEPVMAGHCHCRKCQHATGGAKASAFAVPEDSVTVTGELTSFDFEADSGNMTTRQFCPTCGVPVTSGSIGMPGLVIIYAGSLDDPSIFAPGMDIYTDSAQPWDHMDPDLPKFPGMPEMPG
ncbi:MAG: GFA family protein [Alphaproteobacteria bacterium]|jgi:hypothetical protein|nr:GFA family protein [Alphaproteobacteria bacterium]MBT7942746.1 GFA family protein [Alphaproteobacteria bacterium]